MSNFASWKFCIEKYLLKFNMFGKLFKRNKEQVKLFYHTDVHSHILPGVDHGSQSLEMSLEMLRAQAEMGINRVILTSHVTAITFENTRETLTDAFLKLKDAVTDEGLDMELFLSAEYRMDEYFDKEYAADHLLPMPGNHVLLENSFQQELMNLILNKKKIITKNASSPTR